MPLLATAPYKYLQTPGERSFSKVYQNTMCGRVVTSQNYISEILTVGPQMGGGLDIAGIMPMSHVLVACFLLSPLLSFFFLNLHVSFYSFSEANV